MGIAAQPTHGRTGDHFPAAIFYAKPVVDFNKELRRLFAFEAHQRIRRIAAEGDALDLCVVTAGRKMSILLEMIVDRLLHCFPL